MDLRQHVRPIPGQQLDGATGEMRRPRRALSMVAVIVAALLLGAALGRTLPTKPEASVLVQSPSPAAEPVVSYVNIPPQIVDQPVSEEYIPTF